MKMSLKLRIYHSHANGAKAAQLVHGEALGLWAARSTEKRSE